MPIPTDLSDRRLQLWRLHDELADHADHALQGRSHGCRRSGERCRLGQRRLDALTTPSFWAARRGKRPIGTTAKPQFSRSTKCARQPTWWRAPTTFGCPVLEDYLLDRALHQLNMPSDLLLFPGEGHELDKNPWHGKIKVREELKWLEKYGGLTGTN